MRTIDRIDRIASASGAAGTAATRAAASRAAGAASGTVSRRAFVAGAAGTAAAAAATAALVAPALAAEGAAGAGEAHGGAEGPWDYEADVVVVGGGAAGHAAALEASQTGLDIVLLEAAETVGGDSARCAGIVAGWGTRLAKELGVECTADEIYADFMAHPDWFGALDPEVARMHADRCGATIDWLDGLGVPFYPYVGPRFAYTDLPVIHLVEGGGAKMMEVLENAVADMGVAVHTSTRAMSLVFDGDGCAVGVEALGPDGQTVRYLARGGVVIASGGFSGDTGALTAMSPGNACLIPGSCPTDRGDGIVMAMKAGVTTTRTSRQPLTTALAGMMTGTAVLIDYLSRLHGILLDQNGARFCSEGADYRSGLTGRYILQQQNLQGGRPVVYLLGTNPDLDAYLAQNGALNWACADTVEEVAAAVGLDPAAVAATMEQYNAYCADGLDRDFLRPAEDMVPLTGPFYAAEVYVSTSVTVGGIKVDTMGRAQRMATSPDGSPVSEPVPGLFAAGCACEWNVANGWTVLSGITMGRIAGGNAALRALGQ